MSVVTRGYLGPVRRVVTSGYSSGDVTQVRFWKLPLQSLSFSRMATRILRFTK